MLHRQFRLVALCFLVLFAVPVVAALALRPSFTAMALVLIEPAPSDLLEPGGLGPATAPNTAMVDGAVELMRSEPVLTRALALVAPVDPNAFSSSLDFRSKVLAFFGNARAEGPSADRPEAQVLKLARSAVTVNRRGLTPVIAISARSASPSFAARMANAMAQAHMELQWEAKAETLDRAKGLVDVQLSTAEARLIEAEADPDLAPQLATLRNQRDALQHRALELTMQAALQLPDARLAAPASIPVESSFPDVRNTALIAALFAAVTAIGIGFTADGWASGVRSTTEFATLVGAPLAIAMPRLRMRRSDGTSHADQVVTAPLSPFSEAMRSLQMHLTRSPDAQPSRVIAVMSAGEGEGKTTTALGVARAFVAAGQNVLLIDADVRSAALRQHLDVPSSRGFEAVLSGALGLADVPSLVQRDPLSALNVLINSGPSTLPAEAIFGTGILEKLLQSARSSFDVTVIDMPSFRWPADSSHILRHADAVVLVAGWGRAERRALEDMLVSIRASQGGRHIPVHPVLSMQPHTLKWSLSLTQLSYASR
ncbi:hypothetical protein ASE94_01280 [Devosia sp. Leaf64]|nr:hypothetical protein ASE94_01280 [Devosia sp. Leaf64]